MSDMERTEAAAKWFEARIADAQTKYEQAQQDLADHLAGITKAAVTAALGRIWKRR